MRTGLPSLELQPRVRWVLFLLVLAASTARYLAQVQPVLDDTFIYLDLARNWLAGIGPRFRAGDQHLPATSPLWLAMLAATKLALPGLAWETVCRALYLAGLALAAVVLHLLLSRRHALAAAMAPIVVFWAPSVPSLCGHDTALATLVALLLLLARQRRHWRALPAFAALFYLARGEGAVFGAAVIASAALANGATRPAIAQQVRAMAPGLFAGGLLVAAWHGYLLVEFGKLLPSTLAAKVQQTQAGWPSFWSELPKWFWHGLWSPWLAAAGAVPLLLHCRGLVAWLVVHCGFMAVAGVAAYHWYYYPLELVSAVAVLLGLDLIAGAARLLPWPRAAPHLARALAAMALVAGWLTYRDNKQPLPDRRQTTYRAAADWLLAAAERLPTHGQRRPRLLTDEVGLLAFYLPGFDVHDTVGLADPVRDVKQINNVAFHLHERRPDFVLLAGPPDRQVTVVTGSQGWELLSVVHRPAPDCQGRYVHAWPAALPPEGSPERRVFELAALTQQPIATSGPMHPVQVPPLGPCVFAHAPSQLGYDLPAGRRQVALAFGMLEASWKDAAASDGVGFAVDAVLGDGKVQRVCARELRPETVAVDRELVRTTVELPEGTRRLHLFTEPLGNANWDYAYWALVEPK